MCIRYLGFLLLICLPGILHGQSAQQSCTAPNLDGGFFAPKLETYPHGAQLTYTCNSGRVPVVRGWWVTSSCQNGKWSHEPQCIESLHACSVPPKIPHAIIINQEYQDLFAADSVLQYECEEGFTVEGVDTKKNHHLYQWKLDYSLTVPQYRKWIHSGGNKWWTHYIYTTYRSSIFYHFWLK
ncbi:coagulation factor XIII B chain-like isoform X1 [Scomber japonicus]|uniref:coagulation factor XIII B chain-like isoform X1 n=1 Tax=Scomber japonicus TaxID=13676 RepID=UPI0023060661|nr:coagulation factor XIII B chain-like isoform X1 [Scomber japonicus]